MNGAIETIKHVAKIPWEALAAFGAFLAVFITVTWWNTKNIRSNAESITKLSETVGKIFTGELKTKNGEIQTYHNGEQDKKLEAIMKIADSAEKRSKSNSDEIQKIWDTIGKIKDTLKKFTENQEVLQKTLSGMLGETVNLVTTIKAERQENSDYLKKIGATILGELKKIGRNKVKK